MPASYEKDVIAWAKEQAHLLRSGQLSKIDVNHIAEEIEDVGKSEQREIESRMAVLLSHLLKWQFQSSLRSKSWEITIREQRKSIKRRLSKTPSLQVMLNEEEFLADVWSDAVVLTVKESNISTEEFPDTCIWSVDQILDQHFMPNK